MSKGSLSWQVAPGEAPRGLPPEPPPEPPTPPRRRWAGLALLAGVVVLVLASQMWRAGRDVERERATVAATLADHAVAEAQAMAAGQAEDAPAWLDPAAEPGWAQRYGRLFGPEPVNPYNELCGVYGVEWHPNPARPEVALVAIEASPSGRRVVARLSWSGGSGASELRAYREVTGRWRRSPLSLAEITRGDRRTVEVGSWRVTGPAGDVADVTIAAGPGVDLLRLDGRLRQDVPGGSTATLPATQVNVVPTEFAGPVVSVALAPERRLILNSPGLALVNPDGPLSAAALYRLALVSGAASARAGLGVADLPFAPFWALDEAEQKAVRNRLREELDGAWRSQLAPEETSVARDAFDAAGYKHWQRGCISDALLLQQLLATGRVQSLAELAGRLMEGDDAVATLLALSGQPDRPAFERWARAWATTPEP